MQWWYDQFYFFDISSSVQLLQRYKREGHDTIILAGAEYGSGSSRDWAAKGPMLLVKTISQHPS